MAASIRNVGWVKRSGAAQDVRISRERRNVGWVSVFCVTHRNTILLGFPLARLHSAYLGVDTHVIDAPLRYTPSLAEQRIALYAVYQYTAYNKPRGSSWTTYLS